jgi:LPS O-antigen subunit length determinant protein (WzzB/FepE family)
MTNSNNFSTASDLSNIDKSDEIDLISIIKTIWDGRKVIIISIIIGAIIGLFMAVTTQPVFTVTTVMVPQMSTNDSRSQLGGLAALAGLNVGMNQSSDLSPLVYPKIVNSVPFKLELMNTPLNFSKVSHPVSLFEYLTKYSKPTIISTVKKYTFGLPALIISTIRRKPKELVISNGTSILPLNLTRSQYEIKKLLDGMITLEADKKEGVLTLTVRMIEPLATAQLAKKAQDILQRDIIKFKIDKTKADLDFIEGRYKVAKSDFERIQIALASSIDRNRDLTSGISSVQRDRIQTQYTISYSVFQDLAKQLEQAKIQVKKETPVFTIVEPVTIPIERTSPNRPMILLMWMILGSVIGVGIIYGKLYFMDLQTNSAQKVKLHS